MTLSLAIDTRDAALLPSRRDEDWRWSDLRGLIRAIPPASPPYQGSVGEGPFAAAAVENLTLVSGRGPAQQPLRGVEEVAHGRCPFPRRRPCRMPTGAQNRT